MKWIYKVAGFKLLGICPFGETVYRALQKNVTRSLEVTEARIAQKCQVALEYLDRIHADAPGFDLSSAAHVDIGAGWMPTIPLLMYAQGVERQLLCDVRRNLEVKTVAEVVTVFNRLVRSEPFRGLALRRVPEVLAGQTLDDYFAGLGIEYRAPYSLPDIGRVKGPKLVTCTQILYYLRPEGVGELLRAVAEAIRGEGLFATTIHLHDLYADADPALNPYNKYRYSEAVWNMVLNGRFVALNRLTAVDYRRLFEESGLRPIRFELTPARPEDLAALRRVPLARPFRAVPEAALAARHLLAIADSTR